MTHPFRPRPSRPRRDPLVGSAAAEFSSSRRRSRRAWRADLLEQRVRREDHARRAVAALEGALRDEGLLQRVELLAAASPSMVTTFRPAIAATGVAQACTAAPSTSTVQAPHTPRRSRTWRRSGRARAQHPEQHAAAVDLEGRRLAFSSKRMGVFTHASFVGPPELREGAQPANDASPARNVSRDYQAAAMSWQSMRQAPRSAPSSARSSPGH